MRTLLIMLVFLAAAPASAGVFNTSHFVSQGEFAIGVEPELTLTNGAGMAANLRYTHGLTDLNNLSIILGTGGGPRRFRVGGNLTFDFVPDIENQPGIGIAVQGLYYRVGNAGMTAGQFELTGIPYIHKAFQTSGNEIEPYFGFPFGMAFSGGQYQWQAQAAFGAMFKNAEHIRYDVEFGFNISHSESYISGGIIYYH